ncbi:type II toxin-antitoxin system Phd/YefM family antitoxin [Aerococcus viridans]|uniref:type II toxin-antitoxin system Phd/YefM family antitoxin n=1 Tax=Aerococcus viridans TaxID=1377 RepID=UPI0002D8142E|nr:type II toxin-antitoxin system Phd/YefM family antitoxin [Aerococcus viridans]
MKEIHSEDEPLFIKEKGEEPLAVLLSLDEYELLLESIKFYSSPENIDYLIGNTKEEYIRFEDIDWEE